jgi:hypothetical protein
MEAVRTSETSVYSNEITQCCIPEVSHLKYKIGFLDEPTNQKKMYLHMHSGTLKYSIYSTRVFCELNYKIKGYMLMKLSPICEGILETNQWYFGRSSGSSPVMVPKRSSEARHGALNLSRLNPVQILIPYSFSAILYTSIYSWVSRVAILLQLFRLKFCSIF